MWWSSQACNNRKRHANASNQWKGPLRHALHFIDSRLRETRDSSCDHLPSCASKANGAEAEAKAKASVGRLWRYLRHFHSIPFILPHLVAASLWKWKLPRNCKIPPHCVIFSLFCFSFFLFSLLCSLCCTLHSGLLSHGGVASPTTYIYRTTNPAATALGSLNICMLDLMWIQIAYQLLNCWKQNKPSSQRLVEQMPYIRRNF